MNSRIPDTKSFQTPSFMQGILSGHLKAAPSALLRHTWSGQYPLSVLPSYIGRHRRCQQGARAAMSTEAEQTQIVAAFKSADDQAAFTGSFKLVSTGNACCKMARSDHIS